MPPAKYIFRKIAADAVEAFLTEMSGQGYVFKELWPLARRITENSDGSTNEEIITVAILMEAEAR